MSHLDPQHVHRYFGDAVTIRATIENLDAAQVTAARFVTGTVVKTLGAGITVSGTIPAILDIVIDKADTQTLGVDLHDWQLAAGGTDPPVVAFGDLQLDPRL